MKTEQDRSREDNRPDCGSLPQKLQRDGLQPSVASAKNLEHLDKSQNTSKDLLLGQNNCTNFNEYKVYLCDYQHQGHKWSVEISAVSFEDAEQRLKALKYGKIVGELKLSIPVPAKQSWIDRFLKLITH